MSHIAENFATLRNLINKAERAAGREEGSVTLVAVSKLQDDEALREALACGQRVFGENRVQEAREHWQQRKGDYPDLQLHLIGPLQTNKVRDAVELFDCIETLDREKLATALHEEMVRQNKNIPCLIQVNTGEEEQKAGVAPSDLIDFYDFCVNECGLRIDGLMCIPPVDDPAALHFARMRKFSSQMDLKTLSMGMSADYAEGIAQGATHVRIGTALFGARN